MTESVRYTRCPKCQTAFKVTDAMLAVAAGQVRCGACLAVFNANDYLLKPKQKSVAANPLNDGSSLERAVSQQSDNQLGEALEGMLSAPSKPDEAEPETAPADDTDRGESGENNGSDWVLPESDNADREAELAEPQTDSDTDADAGDEVDALFASIDEAIADNESEVDEAGAALDPVGEFSQAEDNEPTSDWQLPEPDRETEISTDEMQLPAAETNISDPEPEHPEFEPEAAEFEFADGEEAQDEIAEPATEAEPSAQADAVYDSLDDIDQPVTEDWQQAPSRQEPQFDSDDDIDDLLDEAFSAIDGEEDEMESAQKAEPIQPQDQVAADVVDEDDILDPEQLAENLGLQLEQTDTEPDPLEEFDDLVEEKSRWPKLLIALAVTLLLLVWGASSLWQNRQQLAWSDDWGDTVKSVCGFLPCDLKPRRDIAAIKLRQRQVIPSSSDDKQLEVKMLITNDAVFAQPYPVIVMRFSNSMGQEVALRRISPAQYLPTGSQNELMPASSEVHISFTTELPHPDALGFEFRFE